MTRLLVLSIAFLAVTLVASPADAAKHTKDSLKTIQKNIKDKKKAVLIDVREKREWDGGHLEQATLVSMSDIKDSKKIKDILKKLPKDKKTIVYCHWAAGGRVLQVADILKKHGYDVRPMKTGYKDLVKAGFTKAKPKKKTKTKDTPKK